MAKKTSKSRRSRNKRRKPNVPTYTGPIDAPTPAAKPATQRQAPAKAQRTAVDFSTEYHYVATDLRNMFIVSGLMVVILLVLNLLAI